MFLVTLEAVPQLTLTLEIIVFFGFIVLNDTFEPNL